MTLPVLATQPNLLESLNKTYLLTVDSQSTFKFMTWFYMFILSFFKSTIGFINNAIIICYSHLITSVDTTTWSKNTFRRCKADYAIANVLVDHKAVNSSRLTEPTSKTIANLIAQQINRTVHELSCHNDLQVDLRIKTMKLMALTYLNNFLGIDQKLLFRGAQMYRSPTKLRNQ